MWLGERERLLQEARVAKVILQPVPHSQLFAVFGGFTVMGKEPAVLRAVYGLGGEAQHGLLGFQTKAVASSQEENLHLLNKTSWCVPGPLLRRRAWTQEFKRLYKIAYCQLGSIKPTEL